MREDALIDGWVYWVAARRGNLTMVYNAYPRIEAALEFVRHYATKQPNPFYDFRIEYLPGDMPPEWVEEAQGK